MPKNRFPRKPLSYWPITFACNSSNGHESAIGLCLAHSVGGGAACLQRTVCHHRNVAPETITMGVTVHWRSAVGTDPGLVRESNEDRCYADDERGIFMVVDGIGGH